MFRWRSLRSWRCVTEPTHSPGQGKKKWTRCEWRPNGNLRHSTGDSPRTSRSSTRRTYSASSRHPCSMTTDISVPDRSAGWPGRKRTFPDSLLAAERDVRNVDGPENRPQRPTRKDFVKHSARGGNTIFVRYVTQRRTQSGCSLSLRNVTDTFGRGRAFLVSLNL
jgi:hypothetical protein